jgi:hypothetical protein
MRGSSIAAPIKIIVRFRIYAIDRIDLIPAAMVGKFFAKRLDQPDTAGKRYNFTIWAVGADAKLT